MAHVYRFGMEEEFFLADAETRNTPRKTSRGRVRAFHAAVQARMESAEREMLESQVETCTPPSDSIAETRARLIAMRADLATIGREHGLRVFAAGTHPAATWRRQSTTPAERYRGIIDDLQIVGRRSVVCGLHVHVEVPRPDARLDLQNRLMPFLPILLALSVSSPFWEGQRTGLAGYRLRAYAELPRTGLPELFADAADYDRYVRVMTASGAIADASFLWWHLRASVKYPTLELRIADSCSEVEDGLCIAALFRCLVRLLDRDPSVNAGLTGAARGFAMENLWRAERDGVRAELIDATRERAVPMAEIVEGLLARLAEDADALDCRAACERARTIVRHGTGADRQLAAYAAARAAGSSDRASLGAVVDALADETASPKPR
ncbi:carboxylate-amine ligase [Methylobacterium sp. E-025]|uniref:carboxylate-amine ligase n=1 Tax=Methylobacterium sp. E-025 TaxID=2836561 RepID=UPI001FB9B59E|nr:carboxylate-amine ligase [Methylobacterium sp. E-025]MCJ2114612.1 carboxylate-amine ligase [Methylobacterium sp. E-025]